MQEKQEKESFIKTHFTAKRVAYMAVFTALAFVTSLFEFPIFPATPMLELDFGSVFILLAGFMFGPIEGVIVCVLKELLHIPIGSTGGVGELANIIMTISYIIIPTVVYRFKKGLPTVILTLIIATIFSSSICLLVNRFINFPFFGVTELFFSVWQFIIFFNLIKWTVISVLTVLTYKPFHRLIKKFE